MRPPLGTLIRATLPSRGSSGSSSRAGITIAGGSGTIALLEHLGNILIREVQGIHFAISPASHPKGKQNNEDYRQDATNTVLLAITTLAGALPIVAGCHLYAFL